jgi:hypothetical protein
MLLRMALCPHPVSGFFCLAALALSSSYLDSVQAYWRYCRHYGYHYAPLASDVAKLFGGLMQSKLPSKSPSKPGQASNADLEFDAPLPPLVHLTCITPPERYSKHLKCSPSSSLSPRPSSILPQVLLLVFHPVLPPFVSLPPSLPV